MSDEHDRVQDEEELEDLELTDENAEDVRGGEVVVTKRMDKSSPKLYE